MRQAIALFDEEPKPETIASLEGTYRFVDEDGINIEMLTHIVDVLIYARSVVSDYAANEPALARVVCSIALRLACRIAAWSNESFTDIANRCFNIGLPDRVAWKFASLILGTGELQRDEFEAEAIPPDDSSVCVWFNLIDAALTDTLERPQSLIAIGKASGFVADAIDRNYHPDPFEIALLEEEADSCSLLDTTRIILSK